MGSKSNYPFSKCNSCYAGRIKDAKGRRKRSIGTLKILHRTFKVWGVKERWELSWSRKAAEEAEAVNGMRCSGHGRAYLDSQYDHAKQLPLCECNSCYDGPLCSHFISDCAADAGSGDPYFLEPFWMSHADESAIVLGGSHRMGYTYSDGTYISNLLELQIRRLHQIVGNAVTDGKYILFGAGSTQLLSAAVYALSPNSSNLPRAKVVATAPYFPVYKSQTQLLNSMYYSFEGDTSLWKNRLEEDSSTRFIEFVTSPNNPDGKLKKAVLNGPNVKTIHDYAYYWPHYTPIPAPADDDLMLFTLSKLTGHAGTRVGWAVIKDEEVYQKMLTYMNLTTMGVSRDAQLRALKLLNVVTSEGGGRRIFEFGYMTMRDRWTMLKGILSETTRFSLQETAPQFCTFFQSTRETSPAYAWLKCEREEDKDCFSILKAANINGFRGKDYSAEDRYVRLSLIRSHDDFEILTHHLTKLRPASQQIMYRPPEDHLNDVVLVVSLSEMTEPFTNPPNDVASLKPTGRHLATATLCKNGI